MTRLDRFAEELAEGASVKDAARRVGKPLDGNSMMQRIRKRLGLEQCR